MLFDPFEEQFHLSSALVQVCNGSGLQFKMVGQKRGALVVFNFIVLDPPQFIRIAICRIYSDRSYCLVADDASGLIDRFRARATQLRVGFAS